MNPFLPSKAVRIDFLAKGPGHLSDPEFNPPTKFGFRPLELVCALSAHP